MPGFSFSSLLAPGWSRSKAKQHGPVKDIVQEKNVALSPLLRKMFCLQLWIPFIVTGIFAILGFTASRWNRVQFFILAMILFHVLVNVIFNSFTRYRLPLLSFIFLYGDLFLANRRRVMEEVLRGKRIFFTVPFNLLLLHFRGVYEDLYRARCLILTLVLLILFAIGILHSIHLQQSTITAVWL